VVVINYDYVFHNRKNGDFDCVDGNRVRSTFRNLPMAFESLWCLLRHADLFIGVDSGPLHAAVCMPMPAIYLQKDTNFLQNFYDAGLAELVTVNARGSDGVPAEFIPQAVME
jgi:hypothetical protein